jgi:hypothetical protein
MTKWTDFIKEFAKEKGISFGCAMSDPNCSASYRKKQGIAPKEKKAIPQPELEMEVIRIKNPYKKKKEPKSKFNIEGQYDISQFDKYKISQFQFEYFTIRYTLDLYEKYLDEGDLYNMDRYINEFKKLINICNVLYNILYPLYKKFILFWTKHNNIKFDINDLNYEKDKKIQLSSKYYKGELKPITQYNPPAITYRPNGKFHTINMKQAFNNMASFIGSFINDYIYISSYLGIDKKKDAVLDLISKVKKINPEVSEWLLNYSKDRWLK